MSILYCHNLGLGYIIEAVDEPLKIPESAMKFFRLTGSIGGKSRATKYSRQQLSEWGKKGGRPKGSAKKAKGQRKGKQDGKK